MRMWKHGNFSPHRFHGREHSMKIMNIRTMKVRIMRMWMHGGNSSPHGERAQYENKTDG